MEHSYTIDKIEWERVLLKIHVSCDNNSDFFFVGKNKERYRIDSERSGDGYILKINISCVHNRHFLDNGRWHIIARREDKETICQVQHKLAYGLEDKARIFRYAEEQMAYTVSFGCELIGDDRLILYIDSYFMKENTKWKKRKYVSEVRSIGGKTKRILMSMAALIIAAVYKFLRAIYPAKGDRILLMSETHDYIWGNLKAIDDELRRRKLDDKYKVSYSFTNRSGIKERGVDIFQWIKIAAIIAKQDYIFVDDYAKIFTILDISEKTKLIQVWHAGIGFKSIGYSRFGMEGSPFPENSSHKKYSKVIVASEALKEVYAEAFGIDQKDCLPFGLPRLHGFMDEDEVAHERKTFYEKYPELKGKTIVLFAPTFRGSSQIDAYYNYGELDLSEIYRWCEKKNSAWLFKMHPFINKNITIPEEYSDRILQLNSKSDINKLYYITDILITDYSSSYYEYALTGGACIFYMPDKDIYEITRGVHRSVEANAPGKICESFSELMGALYKEDYEIDKTKKFASENSYEKHVGAAGRIIDEIILGEKHE